MRRAAKASDDIRGAVLGADRPFRVIDGGGGGGGPPRGPRSFGDGTPCPVTPLGDTDGVYHFLDPLGQKRQVSARQLGNRHEVRGLFRGDETWLREMFPDRKDVDDGDGGKVSRVVAFQLNGAAAWLQKMCSDQGLYDDHLKLRRPGIWRGEDGLPIVHCGDAVLIEGQWRPAGTRTGMQIWVATSPTARPGASCDHTVGEAFQNEIQRLWIFKHGGAPQLLLGLIATAMLGTAVWWRPNGFLCGEGGGGKSSLIDALRAACPMHAYSNNPTEAGITGMMNGRVMPIFLDEASDRKDQATVEALMDLVLASASGEGTVRVRGTVDGGHRTTEMAGCVLYGAVNPPSMQPTHLGRITLFELLRPVDGEDYRAEQSALITWAREHGPSLWGRVIASAERWQACLLTFRSALAAANCAPREMDQLGSLLAGWWILTREGLPGEAGAREAIGMAAEFIRPIADTIEDGGPRRAVQHLLAQLIQYDGSTRHEQVGTLLDRCWEHREVGDEHGIDAPRILGRFGMRPVPPCRQIYEWRRPVAGEVDWPDAGQGPFAWYLRPDVTPVAVEGCKCPNCRDHQNRPVPRLSAGGGVWLMPMALKPLWKGAHGLEGDRWQMEILRLGSRSKAAVRVGGVVGKAIWLPREAVDDGSG